VLEAARGNIYLSASFESYATADKSKAPNLIDVSLFLRLIADEGVANLRRTSFTVNVSHIEQTLCKTMLVDISCYVAAVAQGVHKHGSLWNIICQTPSSIAVENHISVAQCVATRTVGTSDWRDRVTCIPASKAFRSAIEQAKVSSAEEYLTNAHRVHRTQ
jgi:hypothetical protein